MTLLVELLDGVAAVVGEGLKWTSAGVATTTGAASIAARSSSERLELLTGTSLYTVSALDLFSFGVSDTGGLEDSICVLGVVARS